MEDRDLQWGELRALTGPGTLQVPGEAPASKEHGSLREGLLHRQPDAWPPG